MKYIFLYGDTDRVSGRWNAPSYIGLALQIRNRSSTLLRIDSFLNYDLGNIKPEKRNGLFVLADGSEVDISLGIFERVCNTVLTKNSYITLGQILYDAIAKERRSENETEIMDLESTIADEIKKRIQYLEEKDICTVSAKNMKPDYLIIDINVPHYLIANSILKIANDLSKTDCVFIEVTDPDRNMTGEMSFLNDGRIQMKFSKDAVQVVKTPGLMCDIPELDDIFNNLEFKKYLEVPKNCKQPTLAPVLIAGGCEKAWLPRSEGKLAIRVGLLTESLEKPNGHRSLVDALKNAGQNLGVDITVCLLNLGDFSHNKAELTLRLEGLSGIVLPGGDGGKMLQEKLLLVSHARTQNIPFLGICLGFQIAVIEFFRSVLGVADATSEEFDQNATNPVVRRIVRSICPNTQKTRYLGSFEVEYTGIAKDFYKEGPSKQRFRHRFGVSPEYATQLEENGMEILGTTSYGCTAGSRLKNHRFFVGTQYHPELTSTCTVIDPIIFEFVTEALRGKGETHFEGITKLNQY